MIRQTVLLASLVASAVAQKSIAFRGRDTIFGAYQNVNGSVEVAQLYRSCEMYDAAGRLQKKADKCVDQLIAYMLLAMAGGPQGFSAASAASGFGNVQESFAAGQGQRRDVVNEHPDHAGDNAATLQDRTVEHRTSSHSVVYQNVHSSNATLSVHTDGDHAIVSFDKPTSRNKRDYLPTNYDYFKFEGVEGLKLDAHALNGTLSPNYAFDLSYYANSFAAYSSLGAAYFLRADSWTYQICNTTTLQTLLYGKIIAEKAGYGSDFEDTTPVSCESVNLLLTELDQTTTSISATTSTTSTGSAIET